MKYINYKTCMAALVVVAAGSLGACASTPPGSALTDAQRMEHREFRGDSAYAKRHGDTPRSSGRGFNGERAVRATDQKAAARPGNP